MVRGIATGRINIRHFWLYLFKETCMGLLSGLSYGLLLALLAWAAVGLELLENTTGTDIYFLCIIIGFGLFASMFIATTVGTFIPLVLEKIKIDPALASGPFVTTAIDILGVGSYLLIAQLILFSRL